MYKLYVHLLVSSKLMTSLLLQLMFQYFTNISCKLTHTHTHTHTNTHTNTEFRYNCRLEMPVDITYIKTTPQLTMEKMDRPICMMEQACKLLLPLIVSA